MVGEEDYPEQKFDFLGFTFQPRRAKNRKGKLFVGFMPAISNKAKKSICDTMRRWKMHRQNGQISGTNLARVANPVLRGWINYTAISISLLFTVFSTSEQYTCSVGIPEIQKIEEK